MNSNRYMRGRHQHRSAGGEEIFKVQLPIATSGMEPEALAYNQDRTISGILPVDDGLRKLVGNRMKSYWYARVREGQLEILRPAPDQDW